MSSEAKGSVAPLVVILAILAACASPVRVTPTPTTGDLTRPASVDEMVVADTVDTAVVQVREFPQSAVVSIVAWGTIDPAYGLRAELRRDGLLIRDHRLYVSTAYAPASASTGGVIFPRHYVQTIAPAGHALKSIGVFRDSESCDRETRCSPSEAFGARIPDDLLRANRDSFAVRLPGRAGTEWTLTVSGEVIDAYLAAVDSVSADLRRR